MIFGASVPVLLGYCSFMHSRYHGLFVAKARDLRNFVATKNIFQVSSAPIAHEKLKSHDEYIHRFGDIEQQLVRDERDYELEVGPVGGHFRQNGLHGGCDTSAMGDRLSTRN